MLRLLCDGALITKSEILSNLLLMLISLKLYGFKRCFFVLFVFLHNVRCFRMPILSYSKGVCTVCNIS